MELIDKAAVIARLGKRLKSLQKEYNKLAQDLIWAGVKDVGPRIEEIQKTISFIDTLEVKEVDLDKSLTVFMSRYAYENGGEYPSAIDIAEHFFELGLKANNDAVIEKACDWLKNNVTYIHPRTGETKCVVNLNAFRDAMKGE